MSRFGTVVVFETEAFVVFDGEADARAWDLLRLAGWEPDLAAVEEHAAARVSELVTGPADEPQFYVTTDPVRLARAARTAARRGGGAR